MIDIKELIPQGKDKAVALKRLSELTGLDQRQIKRLIQNLREDGEVILSSSGGGYFYPTDDEAGLAEVNHYIAMMEAQALGRLARIKSAKRWREAYSQMTILQSKGGIS